jgi:stress-induced morphogen
MGIKSLKSDEITDACMAELKEAIKTEIRNNGATPAGAPLIYEEKNGGFPEYKHYYVVWDRFKGIDGQARSKIVYEAVKESFDDVSKALNITIAMGLTHEEAQAMGLLQN